jgi:hypothetical protein
MNLPGMIIAHGHQIGSRGHPAVHRGRAAREHGEIFSGDAAETTVEHGLVLHDDRWIDVEIGWGREWLVYLQEKLSPYISPLIK